MTDSPIQYRLIKKKSIQVLVWGEIITPHGTFPTPMFMPVGTQATVKTNRQKNSKKWVPELSWPTPTISGFVQGTTWSQKQEDCTSS